MRQIQLERQHLRLQSLSARYQIIGTSLDRVLASPDHQSWYSEARMLLAGITEIFGADLFAAAATAFHDASDAR